MEPSRSQHWNVTVFVKIDDFTHAYYLASSEWGVLEMLSLMHDFVAKINNADALESLSMETKIDLWFLGRCIAQNKLEEHEGKAVVIKKVDSL